MYAVENEHVRDMRRYQRYLLMVLETGATWDDLTSVSYERVWRKLAHLKVVKGIGGKRSTELAIVLLAQAGRWLKRAGKLKHAPAEPEERYVGKLQADWHRITGESTAKARPPRHTPDELGRLLLNLDNRAVDPRIRLVLRTAGEARLGQALRCDRTMLDLSPVGAYGLGRFTVPDNAKKRGALIDLTPDMRAAWDYEMTEGYLRDLEDAYRAGHRKSYPLFPGRRLVRGAARPDVTRPIGDRAATDLWHEFERAAGVEVLAGRAWYGVRRVGADLAEDVQSDGRVLNELTGHTSDEMRRRIYQEQRRAKILKEATITREAARQLAIDAALRVAQSADAGGDVATPSSGPSSWERTREAKRARRRAAHTARGDRAQPTYPPKACAKCGIEFQPTGANAKACETCSPRRVRPAKRTETGTRPTPEPTPAPKTAGSGG